MNVYPYYVFAVTKFMNQKTIYSCSYLYKQHTRDEEAKIEAKHVVPFGIAITTTAAVTLAAANNSGKQ